MAVAASLTVRMGLDTAEFTTNIGKAEKSAQRFLETLTAQNNTFGMSADRAQYYKVALSAASIETKDAIKRQIEHKEALEEAARSERQAVSDKVTGQRVALMEAQRLSDTLARSERQGFANYIAGIQAAKPATDIFTRSVKQAGEATFGLTGVMQALRGSGPLLAVGLAVRSFEQMASRIREFTDDMADRGDSSWKGFIRGGLESAPLIGNLTRGMDDLSEAWIKFDSISDRVASKARAKAAALTQSLFDAINAAKPFIDKGGFGSGNTGDIEIGRVATLHDILSKQSELRDTNFAEYSRHIGDVDTAIQSLNESAFVQQFQLQQTQVMVDDTNESYVAYIRQLESAKAALEGMTPLQQQLIDFARTHDNAQVEAAAKLVDELERIQKHRDEEEASKKRLIELEKQHTQEVEAWKQAEDDAIRADIQKGKSLFESTLTPEERAAAERTEARRLLRGGNIDAETFARRMVAIDESLSSGGGGLAASNRFGSQAANSAISRAVTARDETHQKKIETYLDEARKLERDGNTLLRRIANVSGSIWNGMP